MIEANIPMQELEGQRGEGAYFREDTVHVQVHVSAWKSPMHIHS